MPTARVEVLLARLEKGRAKTLEALAGLAPAQWQLTAYEGPPRWTLRDVVAHWLSAEENLLQLAQDVAAGGRGVAEGFDYDAFNAQEQERLKDRSPGALLQQLDEARRATLDWVRTLDDAQLDRVGRHPALSEISVETIVTAIYGHVLMHMRDVQARLGKA